MTEFEEFLKDILIEEKDKYQDLNIDKIEAVLSAFGFIYRLEDTKGGWATGLTEFKYRGKLTKEEEEVLLCRHGGITPISKVYYELT